MKTYRHGTTIVSLENVRRVMIHKGNQYSKKGYIFTSYYLRITYNNDKFEDIDLWDNVSEKDIEDLLNKIQEILEK